MNPIKIKQEHYLQADITVEITIMNPYTAKEQVFEATGKFCHHQEDKTLTIFFN